jgi:hypothetical protein
LEGRRLDLKMDMRLDVPCFVFGLIDTPGLNDQLSDEGMSIGTVSSRRRSIILRCVRPVVRVVRLGCRLDLKMVMRLDTRCVGGMGDACGVGDGNNSSTVLDCGGDFNLDLVFALVCCGGLGAVCGMGDARCDCGGLGAGCGMGAGAGGLGAGAAVCCLDALCALGEVRCCLGAGAGCGFEGISLSSATHSFISFVISVALSLQSRFLSG